MQAYLLVSLAAMLFVEEPPAPRTQADSVHRAAPVAPSSPGAPGVAFQIREISLGSLDWRGKLMPKLQEVDRQESVSVWAVDEAALKELISISQSDPRGNLASAPPMVVPVGQPARMTNEETIKYVASLKRHADAPPGQASRVAFEPQVKEVHSGVRVHVTSSRMKGGVLFAHVAIDENRLIKMHTASYSEAVRNKVVKESHEGKGLLHDRLHRNIGIASSAVNAQFQVPEVSSRRAEGEWLIPSAGALLISMGPRSGSSGLTSVFEEHLIVLTARPEASRADASVQQTGLTRPSPEIRSPVR